MAETTIRPSRDGDADRIAALYAPHVEHGTASFETEPPTVDEMRRRRAAVVADGWPYLVAECAGELCGYAYASPFRPRLAYRFALEDSIYLAPAAQGRGLGRLLLAELLARSQAAGARQMLAVIGDSGNAGSIGLHRALGFAPVGTLRSVGWKHGRWLDVVLMQKSFGRGDAAPPA